MWTQEVKMKARFFEDEELAFLHEVLDELAHNQSANKARRDRAMELAAFLDF